MEKYKQNNSIKNEIINNLNTDYLEISFINNFFNEEECISYMESLKNKIKWNQDYIKMFGKTHPVPRLTAWYGDKNKTYTYSGISMTSKTWINELLEIKKKVEQYTNFNFNSVLLNFYRSGNDSNSWHSDDEKELGYKPKIVSVSLGGKRKFRLRNKKNKKMTYNIELERGSLLIMSGLTQQYWEHQIPKTKKVVSERINLTFRMVE